MWLKNALLAVLLNQSPEPAPVEAQYEILVSYETRSESEDGSSGSSRGRTLYVETQFPNVNNCSRRGFDLVDNPDQQRPLAVWKFPVTMRECPGGAPTIINEAEMIARLEEFLAAIEVDRELCGRYYMTWNIFQIDCDPGLALEEVRSFDLGSQDFTGGTEYALPEGIGVVSLVDETEEGSGSRVLVGFGTIKPEFLMQEAAKTIQVVDEINGETTSIDEATASLAAHEFSGVVFVRIEIDELTGDITRTVSIDTIQVDAEGVTEKAHRKTTTTRKRVEIKYDPDP